MLERDGSGGDESEGDGSSSSSDEWSSDRDQPGAFARKCARVDARIFGRRQWKEGDGVYVPEWVMAGELENMYSQQGFRQGEEIIRRKAAEESQGNSLAVLRVGGESVVCWSRSGRVGGLRVYRLVGDGFEMVEGNCLFESCGRVRWATFDEMVLEVGGDSSEAVYDEPTVFFVRTRNVVLFLKLQLDFRLSLYYYVDCSAIESVAMTWYHPEEAFVLSRGGSKLSLVEKKDVHVEQTSGRLEVNDVDQEFHTIVYSAHPRSILVAGRCSIYRADFYGGKPASAFSVVDARSEWKLPFDDWGISSFMKHPSRPFQSIIVTETRLAIADERMFRFPLQDWALSRLHKYSHLRCSTASLGSSPGSGGDVIVLGSGYTGSLEVFHSLIAKNEVENGSTSGTVFAHSKMDAMFSTPLIWSDLPLSHLDTFPPTDPIAGVGVLKHDRQGRSFNVVQASSSGLLTIQRIGCGIFEDGQRLFETPIGNSPEGLIGIDNERDLRTQVFAVAKNGEAPSVPYDIYRRNLNFGPAFMKKVRRPYVEDALPIRSLIVRDEDDDVHVAEFGRTARPYLKEKLLVKKQRLYMASLRDRAVLLRGLVEFLCIPRTLSEILEYARKDYRHVSAPLEVEAITGALTNYKEDIKRFEVGKQVEESQYAITACHVYTNKDSLQEEPELASPTIEAAWEQELEDLKQSFFADFATEKQTPAAQPALGVLSGEQSVTPRSPATRAACNLFPNS